MYYYYRYNCQFCGKRTRSKKTPTKGVFDARKCHACHRLICYKCSVGGFCKSCIDSFPEDIGKPYEKKAKILRILHYTYLYIILLTVFLFVSTFLFIFILPTIGFYIFTALSIFVGVLACPGIIINVIVIFIELQFSDRGAKKLLNQFRQKGNFYNS